VPENAARIAHYVNVNGYAGRDTDTQQPPGGVNTLALWGMTNPDANVPGAQNDHDAEQSHIQACTSDVSFAKIYGEFYSDFDSKANNIPADLPALIQWVRCDHLVGSDQAG
jgi:hypothetical protein